MKRKNGAAGSPPFWVNMFLETHRKSISLSPLHLAMSKILNPL